MINPPEHIFENRLSELASILRAKARLAARLGEGRHSWFLYSDSSFFLCEDPKSASVASGPVRSTESNELVGIDFDLNETVPLSTIQLLLSMEIEPFIVGVGQVEVRHTSKGVVILKSEDRKNFLGHNRTPELGGTSQDKEAKPSRHALASPIRRNDATGAFK